MKEICDLIAKILSMIFATAIVLTVFLFNFVVAVIGFVFLVFAYPFVWIYDQFKK